MKEKNSDEKIEKNEELIEDNDEKKSLITFAKLNKYFLIPFLSALFKFLSDLFGLLFIKNSKVIKKFEYIGPILYDLPFVFAGLFYFIPHFQVNVNIKKKSSYKQKSRLEINYLYYSSFLTTINTNKFIIFILLLSIINAIDNLLWAIMSKATLFDERLFELFFIPLFSKIILKDKIYKHQYFSLLISLFGIIFLIIPIFFRLTTDDIVPNILNVINGINFSLFLVLIKYMVEKYYFPPFKICLIIGIISIIIYSIGFTVYSLIKDDFSYFTDCLDFSNEKEISANIYFIFYIIFETAARLTIFLCIFYFSPTLIMVTDMVTPLFSFVANNFILEEMLTSIILNAIGYLITLFSSLIYNEINIFNCFGLNKNTKRFVDKRVYKELEEIKKTESLLSEIDDNSTINDDNSSIMIIINN